jgi:hypothetical protein
MLKKEASIILENIIDTLIEVGNGVTDEDLHEAADQLLKFRDEWFNNTIEKEEVIRDNQVEIEPGIWSRFKT